jgi:hypothetical protein
LKLSTNKGENYKNSLQRNRLQPIRNLLNKKKNQKSTGTLPTLYDGSAHGKDVNNSNAAQTVTGKDEGIRSNFESYDKTGEVNKSSTPADSKGVTPQNGSKKSSNSSRKGVKATPGRTSKYVSFLVNM